MKESIQLPEKQRMFLEKIEHEAKTFLKAELVLLYYSIHIEEAEAKVQWNLAKSPRGWGFFLG